MNRILICIPTYNEAANIGSLIHSVFAAMPEADVVVVDDRSPDGTASQVRALQSQYGNLKLIVRPEGLRGLASAYQAAFSYGLKHNFDYLVQMDADGSHNPLSLRKFINALKDYDFVVGSRYVAGGRTYNWTPYRRWLSRIANIYSAFWLRSPIRDMTSGFVLWRLDALERVAPQSLKSSGFSFQIELKYRALELGLRGLEVPIEFSNRTRLKSKLGMGIIFEGLYRVPLLRVR